MEEKIFTSIHTVYVNSKHGCMFHNLNKDTSNTRRVSLWGEGPGVRDGDKRE